MTEIKVYVCDACRKPIPNILIAVTRLINGERRDFCNYACQNNFINDLQVCAGVAK